MNNSVPTFYVRNVLAALTPSMSQDNYYYFSKGNYRSKFGIIPLLFLTFYHTGIFPLIYILKLYLPWSFMVILYMYYMYICTIYGYPSLICFFIQHYFEILFMLANELLNMLKDRNFSIHSTFLSIYKYLK